MSWSRTFQEDIVYAFRKFCGEFHWDDSDLKLTSLQQLINAWLHGRTGGTRPDRRTGRLRPSRS